MAARLNPCITKKQLSPVVLKNLSTLRAIRIIKRKLNPSQRERFKASCFGKFYHVSTEIRFSGQFVHQLLLRQVDHCPGEDEMWFAIGEKRTRFSQNEFALVTGLSCGQYPSPTELVKRTQSTRLRDRYFGGRRVIPTVSLKEVFLSCTDEEDTFRLSLVYFLHAVLLSRDFKSSIDQLWLSLVDDLESFNEFPWGKLCYQRTLGSLKRIVNNTVWQRHKIRSYSLYGFPYALQLWAYEVMPLMGSKFAKKRKKMKNKMADLVPRMLCWKSTESPKYKILHEAFSSKNLDVFKTLRASEFEAEQDYVKGITKFTYSLDSAETMASYAPHQSDHNIGGDFHSLATVRALLSHSKVVTKRTKKMKADTGRDGAKKKIKKMKAILARANVDSDDDDGEKRKANIVSWARSNKGKRKQRKRRAIFATTESSKKQKIATGETMNLNPTHRMVAKETGELREWLTGYQKNSAYPQALVPECLGRDHAFMSNINISWETERETSRVVDANEDRGNAQLVQELRDYDFIDAIVCGRSVNEYPHSLHFLEAVDAVLQHELVIGFPNDG